MSPPGLDAPGEVLGPSARTQRSAGEADDEGDQAPDDEPGDRDEGEDESDPLVAGRPLAPAGSLGCLAHELAALPGRERVVDDGPGLSRLGVDAELLVEGPRVD